QAPEFQLSFRVRVELVITTKTRRHEDESPGFFVPLWLRGYCLGNCAQVGTSEPQYSMHLARSIGPFPTTFANRKSATCSISRTCSVAGGSGRDCPFFASSACFMP